MEQEVDLASETNVVYRRGSVVTRNAGPHSTTVHALLRHLEDVGFEGAPRVVGSGFDNDGREMLTFVEGEIMSGQQPTTDAAAAVGSLLRRLHDATATFTPPTTASWQPWFGRELGSDTRVIGNCDVAPWNVVAVNGLPVAIIDWEVAGPVDPLIDLAQAAWLNARLFSDDVAEREALPPASERARQLRTLVDAYGLSAADRKRVVNVMVEFAIHSVAADADQYDVAPDSLVTLAQWGMAWRARSAAWMLRNRALLEHALS